MGVPRINFFDDDDQLLFETITRGEFNIYGFQNKHLRHYLDGKSGAQVSRVLKRLRLHDGSRTPLGLGKRGES